MLFGPLLEQVTKEELITAASSNNGPRIVDFTPLLVTKEGLEPVKGAQWLIIGDAKLKNSDKETAQGAVFAQFKQNKWYFSGIGLAERR